MTSKQTRRTFINHSGKLTAGAAIGSLAASGLQAAEKKRPLYKISCTEYSLHKMIGKGELDHLDYVAFIRKHFNIDAVEYWNRPFFDKAEDEKYVADMRKRADDVGVGATAILVDGEGNLGDPQEKRRIDAVNRHKRWVSCAKQLGCHSIRVNARSKGSYEEQGKLAADGLRRLSEFGKEHGLNIIVENHGGLSSNGEWLAGVMKEVGLDNCGTLPDFGNFGDYDRYKGTRELMPYAKLVSAKSHDFDEQGNETRTDYRKIMKIVVDAGYHDYVGIEYEGGRLSEVEGIRATKKLLERVREQLG